MLLIKKYIRYFKKEKKRNYPMFIRRRSTDVHKKGGYQMFIIYKVIYQMFIRKEVYGHW